MLGTRPGTVDGLPLGTCGDIELGRSERSTDGNADGKFEGL